MGKLILNGRNYSGLIDAQGVFIDTENVIVPQTSYNSTMSYTAAQDCYVHIYICNKPSASTEITIDGKRVHLWWRGSVISDTVLVPLMKGQTIAVVNADTTNNGYYIVYGIQMGSEVTFLSEYASACYDTNEREVGCWVDGKPLYQRTFDIGSTTVSYNSWTVSSIPKGDMETITHASAVNQNGKAFWGDVMTSLEVDSTYVALQCGRNGANEIMRYVTLYYTKTTDVAGSGSWTPTAMPTVHYDGNEKVVGTWFGDTLYEATIQTAIPNNTQANYPHGIADIDKIVGIEGGAWDGSQYLPINMTGYVSGSNEGALRVTATKTNISVLPLLWDGSSYTGYWTIRYTKSTD